MQGYKQARAAKRRGQQKRHTPTEHSPISRRCAHTHNLILTHTCYCYQEEMDLNANIDMHGDESSEDINKVMAAFPDGETARYALIYNVNID